MGFATYGVVQGFMIILTLIFLIIFIGLLLLRIKNKTVRFIFLIPSGLGLIFFSVLTIWTTIHHQNRIEKTSQSYVGEYFLTNYKAGSNYTLTLKGDHSYIITPNDRIGHVEESGNWEYFDDGDIFYIELETPDGLTQLGTNNYEYIK